jgi:hypothetical protein
MKLALIRETNPRSPPRTTEHGVTVCRVLYTVLILPTRALRLVPTSRSVHGGVEEEPESDVHGAKVPRAATDGTSGISDMVVVAVHGRSPVTSGSWKTGAKGICEWAGPGDHIRFDSPKVAAYICNRIILYPRNFPTIPCGMIRGCALHSGKLGRISAPRTCLGICRCSRERYVDVGRLIRSIVHCDLDWCNVLPPENGVSCNDGKIARPRLWASITRSRDLPSTRLDLPR